MIRARSRSLRVLLALAAFGIASAWASERSELLVAQGEVAYHAGRIDEARQRFADALAADSSDAAARAWLDVLEASVPREPAQGRPSERAATWWDLEAGTGVEYDSNPRLEHSNHHQDAGFLFSLDGHVDPYRDDRTLVRLDYDFYQVLYVNNDDFDERTHNFRATVSRAVVPGVWVGVQGGYNHTTLDTHAYLQEPWVMPYLSVLEGDRGSTQVSYRYGQEDYLGSPFDTATLDRSGPLNAAAINQLLFFFDHRLTLTLGYAYEQENPNKSSGDDFVRHTNQGLVGVRVPAWWRTLAEFDYIYRSDDYTEPQSTTGTKRHDDGNYLATFLRHPIIPHLDAVVSYLLTINGSNISTFDYHRNILAAELRYTF
jgi:hypothetical protein